MADLTLHTLMPEHPTHTDSASTQVKRSPQGFLNRANATGRVVLHHVVKHTGVGIVCSVAYFDP
jgi:metal iron transporter